MASAARKLWLARDLRTLFIGQTVSGFGDWLATFGFISLVYSLTGSSTNVAIVLILRLVPPIFSAPIGGLLADRLARRTIMVSADLLRAALILFVPFFGLGGVYVIAFIHEFISLFFLPARDAVVPRIAPKGLLDTANGLIQATSYASLPIAGALFSLLNSAGGVYPSFLPFSGQINAHPEALAFFVDSLTFVASAGFILGMHYRDDQRRIEAHRHKSIKEDLLEGVGAVWRAKAIRSLAYGILVAMFGAGVLFAVGIGYVRHTLHGSSATFGWLTSLWGVGMVVGLSIVQRLVQSKGRRYIFAGAIIAMGSVTCGMALLPVIAIAFALAIPFGTAFAVAMALAITIAQTAADPKNIGRVLGGVQSLYRIGLGIGAISIGIVASTITGVTILGMYLDGDQFGLLISGVFMILGALVTMWTRPT